MFGAHDVVVKLSGSGTVEDATIGESQRGQGSLYEHALGLEEARTVVTGWANWQSDRRSWTYEQSVGLVLEDGWGNLQTWSPRPGQTFHLGDFPGGIELLAYVRVDGSNR